MTTTQNGRRDRRAVLLGAAVILVSLTAVRGAPGLLRWISVQQQAARRLGLDVADARAAERAAAWLPDSARLREQNAVIGDSLFLEGDTPASAAADLVSELADDAAQAKVTVGAIDAHPTADSNTTVRRISARTSVSGDLGAVMQFLAFVEVGAPLLSVREASLVRRGAGPSQVIQADFAIDGFAHAVSHSAPRTSR